MPIQSSDIVFKYSLKTGSAGNSAAQPDPAQSLGKYISTTVWAGGVLHDLFPLITGAQNAGFAVDYRCIFVHNAHASLPLTSAKVWISAEVASGATAAIGIDPTAASAIGASSAQAVQVTDGNTAPVGVTFSSPTTEGAGLSLGDIPAGSCKALWVRRSATNSAALNNDGFTLTVKGDTAA
jgi:hypothetical protein